MDTSRKIKIKKIRPFSLGVSLFIIFLVIGLVVALVTSSRLLSLGKNAYSNFVIIVAGITLGYALLGFLLGLVSAIIYNLTLKLHGGIKMETENV
jgi:uncharacterized protein YacL